METRAEEKGVGDDRGRRIPVRAQPLPERPPGRTTRLGLIDQNAGLRCVASGHQGGDARGRPVSRGHRVHEVMAMRTKRGWNRIVRARPVRARTLETKGVDDHEENGRSPDRAGRVRRRRREMVLPARRMRAERDHRGSAFEGPSALSRTGAVFSVRLERSRAVPLLARRCVGGRRRDGQPLRGAHRVDQEHNESSEQSSDEKRKERIAQRIRRDRLRVNANGIHDRCRDTSGPDPAARRERSSDGRASECLRAAWR